MYSDEWKRIYSNMAFPMGREDFIDGQARAGALAVLAEAADRCGDRDMRTAELLDALAYLHTVTTRPDALRRFRRALDIAAPVERFHQVAAALKSIRSSAPKSQDVRRC